MMSCKRTGKIAKQMSSLFQEFKTLYEPCCYLGAWKRPQTLGFERTYHYAFLGHCPPTPPLSQHFALSEK